LESSVFKIILGLVPPQIYNENKSGTNVRVSLYAKTVKNVQINIDLEKPYFRDRCSVILSSLLPCAQSRNFRESAQNAYLEISVAENFAGRGIRHP
jgi:hypothetical protein